jgi:hypothetical protein
LAQSQKNPSSQIHRTSSQTSSSEHPLVLGSKLQELSLLLLPVLGASGLAVALLLVLSLRSTDSGSAGNGLGAEVRAVALLGGAVDDALVELAGWGGCGVGGGVVELGGLVLLGGLGCYGDCVAVGLDADGLNECACLSVGVSGQSLHTALLAQVRKGVEERT